MKHKNTLIILTPGFPANESDTNSLPFPQAFVKNLARVNPDLEVIVLAFQYPFSSTPYQWNDVQVFPFNGNNKGGIRRLLTWKAVLKKLSVLVKANNVVGLLSLWLGECALIGKYAARKYQVKHFTWLLGQDARSSNRYVKWIKPCADDLIALSDAIADECYHNHNLRPAHTIQLGIDTKDFQKGTTIRSIDIIGVGSLIPLKQYALFICTVAKLVKNGLLVKAIICGDGPKREKLQRLIDEKGLKDQIEMKGNVPHADVLELMRSSRILLHPSVYEGFSTVCAEALYAGAHVVSLHKPMHQGYEHMHIVKDENEMFVKLVELLSASLDHDSVLVMPIEEVCRKISALYEA